MARPYRIQYPNAVYHVMNRGLNRRNIFNEQADFHVFLKLCEKSWERWGLEVFAYCLMPNHYHLCLRTPEGNLSRIMRHLDGLYTQSFNRRHGRDGPLFRGRYKAILIQQEEYLAQLVRYIHLNPVKAKMAQSPQDYSYSSYRYYLSLRKRPTWLNVDLVRNCFKSRKAFVEHMLAEQKDGLDKILSSKRLPVILGTKDFIQKICKQIPKPGLSHARHERQKLRPSINQILQIVTEAYGVSKENIEHGIRGQNNEARKVAMWLCKEYGDLPYSQIAKAFNVKSHYTAGWNCRQIDQKKASQKAFKRKLTGIIKKVNE